MTAFFLYLSETNDSQFLVQLVNTHYHILNVIWVKNYSVEGHYRGWLSSQLLASDGFGF